MINWKNLHYIFPSSLFLSKLWYMNKRNIITTIQNKKSYFLNSFCIFTYIYSTPTTCRNTCQIPRQIRIPVLVQFTQKFYTAYQWVLQLTHMFYLVCSADWILFVILIFLFIFFTNGKVISLNIWISGLLWEINLCLLILYNKNWLKTSNNICF